MSELSDALARIVREHASVLGRHRAHLERLAVLADERQREDRRGRCFMEELRPRTCQRLATEDPDGSGEPYLCESCAKDVAS